MFLGSLDVSFALRRHRRRLCLSLVVRRNRSPYDIHAIGSRTKRDFSAIGEYDNDEVAIVHTFATKANMRSSRVIHDPRYSFSSPLQRAGVFSFMRHRLSALVEKVRVQRRGKGRDAHYIAECPLCPYSYLVDVRTSEKSAEVLAVQNVTNHLKTTHGDEIDMDAEQGAGPNERERGQAS